MNKILFFFLALSLSLTACAQGDPSPFIKGQNATGLGNQASTVIVPYRQSTKINAYQALIETGNLNMLANGEFEGTASTVPSGWTCTTGTCTKTTSAGEFSSGLAAMKIVAASNVIDVSQAVSTTSGIQKQGFARVIYRVPNTCSTFKILTTVDSATQTTVPTANLVYDNTFRSIEVPLTFGSTNAGIKFTASTTCTGNIFVDGAILAQGLGLQNLQGDVVYSATISSGTTVSTSKSGWVSCTNSSSAVCTFQSGLFTVAPTCTATTDNSLTNVQGANFTGSISKTSVTVFQAAMASATPVNGRFYLTCVKQGNDYLAASSNVYSQASANYDWTAFTPTLSAGFGSPTLTNVCRKKREAGDMLISCALVTGTTAGSLATMTIPDSLSIDTTRIVATNTTAGSGQVIGYANQSTAGHMHPIVTATGTSSTLLYFSDGISSATLVPSNGNVMSSSTTTTFNIRIPISGWSNSNVIVGSFENVPTVPGAGARIDTFSVSFGTTNATTACSASPCSYLDQIGSAVTSITRSGAGLYSLNTSKTYTKLKCTANTSNVLLAGAIACNNCSAVAVNNISSVTTTYTDGYGTILCQGSY